MVGTRAPSEILNAVDCRLERLSAEFLEVNGDEMGAVSIDGLNVSRVKNSRGEGRGNAVEQLGRLAEEMLPFLASALRK